MVVMRKCVARYPALCTQEGGELTFPMTAPGSKAASGPIETRRGGTSIIPIKGPFQSSSSL